MRGRQAAYLGSASPGASLGISETETEGLGKETWSAAGACLGERSLALGGRDSLLPPQKTLDTFQGLGQGAQPCRLAVITRCGALSRSLKRSEHGRTGRHTRHAGFCASVPGGKHGEDENEMSGCTQVLTCQFFCILNARLNKVSAL